MSVHYAATGARTLCGSLYSERMELAHLWPEFIQLYKSSPERCCERCLQAAKKWQRFSQDIAAVNVWRKTYRPDEDTE